MIMNTKNNISRINRKDTSLYEKIVTWGVLLVFMSAPLLYWSNRIAAAVTSKQYFFIGAVEILLFFWIILQLKDKKYRFSLKESFALVPVTAFVVSAGVSSFFGSNILTSLYSTIERGGGFIFIVHALVFSCIVGSLVKVNGLQFIKKIGQALLFSGAIVSLFTFFTKEAIDIGVVWLNESTGGATLGNSTIAGAYFVFVIFMGLVSFLLESSRFKKVIIVIGLGTVFISPILFGLTSILAKKIFSNALGNPLLFIGQARAATLSILFGFFVAFLFYVIKTSRRKILSRVMAIFLLIVVASIGYGFLSIFRDGSVIQRKFISTIGENRILFWREAIFGIKERPIIGWGLENYKIVHQKYFNPKLADNVHGKEIWVDKPHNSLIEITVTQGYVGLLAYIVLIISILFLINRSINKGSIGIKEGSLLIGMLVAYLLQNQLAFDSNITVICFFALVGIVIGVSSYTNNTEDHLQDSELPAKGKIGIIIIGIVLIPVWLNLSYFPARKTVAIQKLFNDTLERRMETYESLYTGPGSYIVKTSLPTIFYKISEAYSKQRVTIKNNPEFLSVATQDTKKILEIGDRYQQYAGKDYRFVLSQAIFQSNLMFFTSAYSKENVGKSFAYIDNAIKLSPKNPFIHMLKSIAYIYYGNIEEARKSIDYAITLNKNVLEAHEQKIAFEEAYGTKSQQREALENAQKAIPGYEYTPR